MGRLVTSAIQFSSFASQLPAKLNRLYSRYEKVRLGEKPVINLIGGNVTEQGVSFPNDRLKNILREATGKTSVYQPTPFGEVSGREAIGDYYKRAGLHVSTDQILLTPGTSISYFYCLKLLASPGDEILCPTPSYPLFETIAQLCDVGLQYYRLRESAAWEIDLDYLESQISTRTRALVLISPHNPTGHVTSYSQLDGLAEIVNRHQLPIIADEVFSEFLFGSDALPRPALTTAPLVLTLNGFSKMFALPGLKIGWIIVSGQIPWVQKSLKILELVLDALLPVNDVSQYAVAQIFDEGVEFQVEYQQWIQDCWSLTKNVLSRYPGVKFVPPQGGFYLALDVGKPEIDEEALCISLLESSNILVHPGYFYDMTPGHLVLTFILQHDRLDQSLQLLCQHVLKWLEQK